MRSLKPLAFVLACSTLSQLNSAYADSAADFFKGKQVTMTVGYGPGGGYDVYSRLLARHLGPKVPGQPGIVVQNMPGAGSLRAANYLYNGAPQDGTAYWDIFAQHAIDGHSWRQ